MDKQIKIEYELGNSELRDKFAMASIDAAYHHCRKTGKVEAQRIAQHAYDLAEAMMEERAKR